MAGGGVFGIITEITMRIYKIAPLLDSIGYLFHDYESVYKAELELSETTPVPFTGMFASSVDTFGVSAARPLAITSTA
jgi:FAD/FMN-containing dehydrogenase